MKGTDPLCGRQCVGSIDIVQTDGAACRLSTKMTREGGTPDV